MLYIEKSQEPAELTQAKLDGLSRYEDLSGEPKKAVQQALLREQGAVCAYCMKRVSIGNLQIEHYIAQNPEDSDYDAALTIDYNNMLGVCTANKFGTGARERLTCDQHRGNAKLTVDPRNEASVAKIKYKTDGTIYSDDADIQRDLDVILNLNCSAAHLKENRRSAMDALKRDMLKNFPGKQVTKAYLEKRLAFFRDAPVKTEFAGVLIWYLNRQLMRS